MGRQPASSQKPKLRKGLWSPDEDEKLQQYITRFGLGCWSSIAKQAGLQRCGKSCRLRWINYLRPDLRRGSFSAEEEKLIIELHDKMGNRWARIAQQLPGRTDNDVKNFWNSYLKKKLSGSSSAADKRVSGPDHRKNPFHHVSTDLISSQMNHCLSPLNPISAFSSLPAETICSLGYAIEPFLLNHEIEVPQNSSCITQLSAQNRPEASRAEASMPTLPAEANYLLKKVNFSFENSTQSLSSDNFRDLWIHHTENLSLERQQQLPLLQSPLIDIKSSKECTQSQWDQMHQSPAATMSLEQTEGRSCNLIPAARVAITTDQQAASCGGYTDEASSSSDCCNSNYNLHNCKGIELDEMIRDVGGQELSAWEEYDTMWNSHLQLHHHHEAHDKLRLNMKGSQLLGLLHLPSG